MPSRISALNKLKIMTDTDDKWAVLPHGPITELSTNLWRVEGDLPHFGLKRVMTVVRLADGRLVIHSGIALDEPSMKRLEAWGAPTFLIIPHGRHRLDAPRYKARYPALRVLAPPAVLEKARAAVPSAGGLAEFPADPDVRFELLDGMGDSEVAMVVRSPDGTSVVLTEVVFDLLPAKTALGRAAIKLSGLGPGPRVTPFVKLELVKDKARLAAHLERLAALPDLVRLIVSHSRLSSGADAAAALRKAAAAV